MPSRGRRRPGTAVVLVVFTGQGDPQRVVHVVVPHGVAAPPVLVGSADDHRVVGGAFDGHQRSPPLAVRLRMHRRGEFGDEGDRRRIDDCVHRVEPQAVDVEVAHPPDGVLDEIPADTVAVLLRDIDGGPPGRRVGVGEVRAVPAEHVALGPEMVVHHVEDHSEPDTVRCVDEPGERFRTPV